MLRQNSALVSITESATDIRMPVNAEGARTFLREPEARDPEQVDELAPARMNF